MDTQLFQIDMHHINGGATLLEIANEVTLEKTDRVYYTGCPYALTRNGKVYIDTKAVNFVTCRAAQHLYPSLRVGRRFFFDITDLDLVESVKHHLNYPPRSRDEDAVKQRNRKLWTLLNNLLTALSKPEQQITPMYVYSYNRDDGSNGDTPVKKISYTWRKYRVGDTAVFSAAAPGCGQQTFIITRKDDSGLYGIEIENTMRVMSPEETR